MLSISAPATQYRSWDRLLSWRAPVVGSRFKADDVKSSSSAGCWTSDNTITQSTEIYEREKHRKKQSLGLVANGIWYMLLALGIINVAAKKTHKAEMLLMNRNGLLGSEFTVQWAILP